MQEIKWVVVSKGQGFDRPEFIQQGINYGEIYRCGSIYEAAALAVKRQAQGKGLYFCIMVDSLTREEMDIFSCLAGMKDMFAMAVSERGIQDKLTRAKMLGADVALQAEGWQSALAYANDNMLPRKSRTQIPRAVSERLTMLHGQENYNEKVKAVSDGQGDKQLQKQGQEPEKIREVADLLDEFIEESLSPSSKYFQYEQPSEEDNGQENELGKMNGRGNSDETDISTVKRGKHIVNNESRTETPDGVEIPDSKKKPDKKPELTDEELKWLLD